MVFRVPFLISLVLYSATGFGQAIADTLQPVSRLLEMENGAMTPACRRFTDLAGKLVKDLSTQASEPVRIQIGMSAFAQMEYLLRSGAEGGQGALDPSRKSRCAFQNREALVAAFGTALAGLTVHFQRMYGTPTWTQMLAAQSRLMESAIQDEARDQTKLLVLMAAGTVAAVAVWEFAVPAAAIGIRAMWGYSPPLMAAPLFLYGTKVSALTAEGVAFNYFYDHVATRKPPPRTRIGSWEEQINSIQTFVDSPVHSPDIQLALLSRVHSMMADSDSMKTEEIEMLQLVGGVPIEGQLRWIPQWIEPKFKYRVQCAGFLQRGPSDLECLLGMRNLAAGLASRQIQIPPEPVAVYVGGKGAWRRMDSNAATPAVFIPYNANPADIGHFMTGQLGNVKYQRRLESLEAIEQLSQRIQERTGVEVNLADDLPLQNSISGLRKLLILANESEFPQGKPEIIRLSDRFRPPHEKDQKLAVDIDTEADLVEIRRFLSDHNADLYWIEEFFVNRATLEKMRTEFAQAWGVEAVECSTAGTLTVAECLRALQRLDWVVRQSKKHFPNINLLMITGSSELQAPWDHYVDRASGKQVLLLRHNFKLRYVSQKLKEAT